MFARIPGFFVAFASYIRILFFPVNLHVHYGDITFRFYDARVLSGMLLFFSLIFYAARNRKKDPLFFFALGWFLIFLLPVSNIYRINDSFMKEHWLYLPSVGFFLIVARSLLQFFSRHKQRILGTLGIAATMVFYSMCTINLNAYWKDPLIFLNRSIRYCPDYAVFYNELGCEYLNLGRFEEAAGFFQTALKKNPGLVGVYFSLGVAKEKSGKYLEVIEAYQAALKENPEDLSKYYLIAGCYDKMGQKKDAENIRRQAGEQSLAFAHQYRAKGEKLRQSGRLKDATIAYQRSLSFFPQDISLSNELGCLYVLEGSLTEALKLFGQALAMDPSNATVHNNLALVYYYSRQYKLAIRHCDEAVRRGYRVDPKLLGWLEPYREH
jgi:tetratricopeptide (TPR) repeat protein